MTDSGPGTRPGAAFVGRVDELAVVRAEAERASEGHGRMVVVEGPAGIGKTRLVEEALRGWPGSHRQGQADPLRGRQPFGVVADALGLDLRRARFGRLLGAAAGRESVGSAGIPGLDVRVADALVTHLEDLVAQGPTALVLEDLHWADPSTLVLLHLLEGQMTGWPLLVIATHREDEWSPEVDQLRHLLGRRDGTRLRLGPLADEEVGLLARRALGSEPGPSLLAHLGGASGNPLFATEILDAVYRAGDAVRAADGTVDLPPGSFPASLALLVRSRLRLLPRDTFEVLALAAVFGSRFAVDHLCRLADLTTAAAAHRLRPALEAGVLVEAGDDLAFRHDVVRDALYLDVAVPLRRRLHLDAAHVLAAASAPPEQVAEHLLRGAAGRNPGTIRLMVEVATGLVGRAPSVAADVLQRAIELATDRATRQRLVVLRANALWRAGRLPEAEAAARAVLVERPDPTAQLCLVQVLLVQTRLAEAQVASREGLAATDLSEVVRARLLAWAAFAGMYSGQVGEALDMAEEASSVAKGTGDTFTQVVVCAARAALAHVQGRFGEAIEAARYGLWLERDPSGDDPHLPLELLVAAFLLDAGRLAECRDVIGAALADCAERGSRWELAHCHGVAALAHFLAGWWDEAVAELDSAAAVSNDLGTRGYTLAGLAVVARIALHRGDPTSARAALTTAGGDLSERGPEPRMDWVSLAWAFVLDTEGAPVAAMEAAWQAWHMCSVAGVVSEFAVIGPDVVRFCLAGGDRSRAEEVADALGRLDGTGAPVVDAAMLRSRGLLEGNPGLLIEARDRYAAQGRSFEGARSGEEAGTLLADLGGAADARAVFTEALAGYQRMAATHDAGRVAAALRRLGVRRHGPRSSPRPKHGWEALTAAEAAVAALVAEGLSNPQIGDRLFVSRHTVHTHMSRILAKLGLASRVELAREAALRPSSEGTPPR